MARVLPTVQPRKLAKVPFVELADGRVQGVVSSNSDIERVYVSSVSAGTHALSCSTNNNRPCGGLRGTPCKHLQALVEEAALQYGVDRVARYLHIEVDDGVSSGADLVGRLRGQPEASPAAVVFSRFLRHLSYLDCRTAPSRFRSCTGFRPPGGALMLGTQLADLLDGIPAGVPEALDLVAAVADLLAGTAGTR